MCFARDVDDTVALDEHRLGTYLQVRLAMHTRLVDARGQSRGDCTHTRVHNGPLVFDSGYIT